MSTNTLPFGSISHGTLREEDILPALLDALESVDEPRCNAIRSDWDYLLLPIAEYGIEEMLGNNDCMCDSASSLIDTLYDALQDYTPPYAYCGAHQGDGSDIGVWIDEMLLQEDIHGGVVLSCGEDVPDFPLRSEHAYAYVVNDHGNATLYDFNGMVVWEVV